MSKTDKKAQDMLDQLGFEMVGAMKHQAGFVPRRPGDPQPWAVGYPQPPEGRTREQRAADAARAYDRLIGNEMLKRAIELAVVGGHSFSLIAPADSLMPGISKLLPGPTVSPCPCGEYGQRIATCGCSADEVEAHWAEQRELVDTDIIAIAEVPTGYDRRFASETWKEGPEARMQSVRARGPVPSVFEIPWESGAVKLLEMAIDQFGESSRQPIVMVAATIATLAGDDTIRSVHLSEATQYRAAMIQYPIQQPTEGA